MDKYARLERFLLAELDFESHWALEAWSELVQLAFPQPPAVQEAPLDESLRQWTRVNRFLIHTTRLARLLDLRPGKIDAESRAALAEVANRFRERFGPSILDSRDVRLARNMVEHLTDYIPRFCKDSVGRKLTSISMGRGALPSSDSAHWVVRAFDPDTGLCEVMGHRINLRTIASEIRRFRMLLPKLPIEPEIITQEQTR